jgi:hypothetical protein
VEFYKFKQDYLAKISKIIFPEDLKKDIQDCDLLCISPHNVLHSIPFHALIWVMEMKINTSLRNLEFVISLVPLL